jgi:hypothetical protein
MSTDRLNVAQLGRLLASLLLPRTQERRTGHLQLEPGEPLAAILELGGNAELAQAVVEVEVGSYA